MLIMGGANIMKNEHTPKLQWQVLLYCINIKKTNYYRSFCLLVLFAIMPNNDCYDIFNFYR